MRCAISRTTPWSSCSRTVPGRRLQRAAGRLGCRGRGPHPAHACLRQHYAGRAGCLAVRLGGLHQPRALARRDVPRRVRQGSCRGERNDRRVPAVSVRPSPWSRICGFGSVFAKTVRDSRRATIIVAAFLGLLFVGVAGPSPPSSTRRSRAEIEALVAAVPPILRGMAGKIVNVGTSAATCNTSTASSSRSSSACSRSWPCPGRSPARRNAEASSSSS